MAFRYLAPAAMAVAGAAASQCSIAGTTTISTAAQATAFASCSTFQGSIAIAKGTTDQIALDGIQKMEGSITATDAMMLTSLSADSMSVITDSFTLVNCPALTNLNFPALVNVDTIHWVSLANLQGLSFTQGVQTANSVLIQSTSLGALTGINLEMVAAMKVTENRFLTTVDMPLNNISNIFIVATNGRDFALSLPNLISANNLNIQNVSSVDLASLSSVNGTLNFIDNFVDSFSCPNLTSIQQDLAINGNAELTAVSFPELKTVNGGFNVENNTVFKNATGFPKLSVVGGAVDMTGVFTTVALPKLSEVRGAFNVLSNSGSSTLKSQCNHYMSINGASNIIQGSVFHCDAGTGKSTKTSSGSASPSSAAQSGTASPTTSPSAAGATLISGTTGVLGVLGAVAAVFGML